MFRTHQSAEAGYFRALYWASVADRNSSKSRTQHKLEATSTHRLARRARYLQSTNFDFKLLLPLPSGAAAPIFLHASGACSQWSRWW